MNKKVFGVGIIGDLAVELYGGGGAIRAHATESPPGVRHEGS